jgi:hypothetical protein
MSSGGRVPETRLLGEGELSADHAWRALRRYGSWHLLRDAFLRFRSGDGFSHARALGLQLCLAAVPLLIALNGLASKLGDPHRGGRVVADAVLALTPGASESLVGQLLTDQGRTRDLGQVALSLGLLTAVVALTTAAGQIERGANRIYGVDQDRPAPQKYLRVISSRKGSTPPAPGNRGVRPEVLSLTVSAWRGGRTLLLCGQPALQLLALPVAFEGEMAAPGRTVTRPPERPFEMAAAGCRHPAQRKGS